MPIITISRGSYSNGKAVAEKVAAKLGYECVAHEILIEASEQFNIPEAKLVRALHDSPGILDRISYGKERYVAYIRAALLRRLSRDNVVYHGLAGHVFLKGVSHVLKVRIIADMADRIRLKMERDKISYDEAAHLLRRDDEERRRWSQELYHVDPRDPSLYDLVLHIHKLAVDDAADMICHAVGLSQFRATPESRRAMADLLLGAEAHAAIVETTPDAKVAARDGIVHVETRNADSRAGRRIENIVKGLPGVREVRIHIAPTSIFDVLGLC